MEQDKLIDIEFEHIISDYSALYNYIDKWIGKNFDQSVISNILPFANLIVAEGYDFMVKNQYIISSMELKQQINTIKDCRAASIKLYENFKQKTHDSINDFNRQEYIKFFHKQYPEIKSPYMTREVNNYFLAFINEKPISNYHYLAKKIFDFDIGSYNVDLKEQVYKYTSNIFSFVYKILDYFKMGDSTSCCKTQSLNIKLKYCDLNMAYDYDNFNIKHNPPILMVLLDVLCTLNYYIEIFSSLNEDFKFDLKIKYIILFYAVISVRDIINFCDRTGYDFIYKKELQCYVNNRDNKFNNGKLRRICMHYDFSEFANLVDPFQNAFEQFFNINVNQVSEILKEEITKFAYLLDKAIFKYHVKQ